MKITKDNSTSIAPVIWVCPVTQICITDMLNCKKIGADTDNTVLEQVAHQLSCHVHAMVESLEIISRYKPVKTRQFYKALRGRHLSLSECFQLCAEVVKEAIGYIQSEGQVGEANLDNCAEGCMREFLSGLKIRSGKEADTSIMKELERTLEAEAYNHKIKINAQRGLDLAEVQSA